MSQKSTHALADPYVLRVGTYHPMDKNKEKIYPRSVSGEKPL